jgi:hypothetical protein
LESGRLEWQQLLEALKANDKGAPLKANGQPGATGIARTANNSSTSARSALFRPKTALERVYLTRTSHDTPFSVHQYFSLRIAHLMR